MYLCHNDRTYMSCNNKKNFSAQVQKLGPLIYETNMIINNIFINHYIVIMCDKCINSCYYIIIIRINDIIACIVPTTSGGFKTLGTY